MASSSSQSSPWTLFPEVLSKYCRQCYPELRSYAHPLPNSRIRRVGDLDIVLQPAVKRRVVEGNVIVIETGGCQEQGQAQDIDGVPLRGDSAAPLTARQSRCKPGWILARQWRETVGSASLALPYGHSLVISSLPSLLVSCQDGTVMALVDQDVLAMRLDVHEDRIWADFSNRGVLRSGTVFTAVDALKHTKQVVMEATITRAENSSHALCINFAILLHVSLMSPSLSCKGTIDSAMQDFVHFAFPPSTNLTQPVTRNAIKDLYAHLKPAVDAPPPAGIQPTLLIPQLLPFQQRSVAWCLKRECGVINGAGEVEYQEPPIMDKLPLSWERINLPSSEVIFINRPCGLLCLADDDLVSALPEPRGGILAEEMGLGKTVEMLALILLNRRRLEVCEEPDLNTDTHLLETRLSAAHLNGSMGAGPIVDSSLDLAPALIKSAATLIITPPSILHQWAGEIDNHAPSLRVYVYTEGSHEQTTAEQLAQHDVVLTTYNILSKEINYTSQYDRPRRHERQYHPRKSPFIQIDWWRVCLDEAQMIEGGTVSQAAAMALKIPRVMSWAISGTPIRRHVEDLQSLLMFLNQEPLASNKRLWRLLTAPSFRSTFVSSFQRIMHRYSKKDVEQELALPSQFRLTYGIQFTEIERANYNDQWEQCLADCDVTSNNGQEAERLQSWFMRLRQTCCHPQIGIRNRESLGKTNLRTVDEVLDVMIQQNNAQLYVKERALVVTRTRRAVLSTRVHKDAAELVLFKSLEREVVRHVNIWKIKYKEQLVKRAQERRAGSVMDAEQYKEVAQGVINDDEDPSALDLLGNTQPTAEEPFGSAMTRYRDWQEQHHRILFFTAGFFHELGMEAEEADYYRQAEEVRLRILGSLEQNFIKRQAVVENAVRELELDAKYCVPTSAFQGGILLARPLEQLEIVRTLLNQQLDTLSRWRKDLVERLTQPLMRDGEDGEQYQYSIDLQHTLESYLHFYGRMLLFRKDLLSGTQEAVAQYITNLETERERTEMVRRRENRVRTFKRKVGTGEDVKKEEDLDTRLETEMNGLITLTLRATLRSARNDIKSLANDMSVPRAERDMAQLEDLRLKDEQSHQLKLTLELEKEVVHFRTLTATRTAYYRQLQAISDTVRDIESADQEADIRDCLEEEGKLHTEIVRLLSKQRYLEHLAHTTQKETQDERLCLICRSPYNLGLMTECGHVFCEHCLIEWTKNHWKCPSCNSSISRRRLTRVVMFEPAVSGSEVSATSSSSSPEPPSSVAIQADPHHIANTRLIPDAIRRVTIEDGYGSKIDSIVRHIAFLVREDPDTKCLVFSQWKSLLDVLGDSLRRNRIGYVKLDGSSLKTAVKQFKQSQDKRVFMLHAKSQSAGLTLLSATHIFICEPLVNPVLQAQAVSRVHRIGQTKETFVHYYLIKDTVEIPCFELFERNQAAASGVSVYQHGQGDGEYDVGPSLSAGIITGAGNSGLHSDIATTASEVINAQNRSGELVQLEDVRYCFAIQKQMNDQVGVQYYIS